MQSTLEKESQKIKKKRKSLQDLKYDCLICQEENLDQNSFLAHLKESKKHKEMLKEFQSSLRRINI